MLCFGVISYNGYKLPYGKSVVHA